MRRLGAGPSSDQADGEDHDDIRGVARTAVRQAGWPDHTQMAWPILGVTRFSDVSHALLLEAGGVLGIHPSQANRMLQVQRDRITGEATRLYSKVEAEAEVRAPQYSDLAPMIEGELRCLRSIVHMVIRDMTRKLQAA